MMPMLSILLQTWLLLVTSFYQTSGQSEDKEGESLSTRFDADLLFYHPSILQGKRILDGIFQTASVTSLMECFFHCASQFFCFAINYRDDLLSENCELIGNSWENEALRDDRYSIYILIQDNFETTNFCSSSPCLNSMACDSESESCLCDQGYTGRICEQDPPSTCYDVRMNNWEATSGIYWIQPKPDIEPLEVFCDMETAEGMWTLVYSYAITDYANFNNPSNTLFPRPDWPASEADVTTISTTSPVFGLGAVDYSLWEHIGGNFLITSNINDWIKCGEDSGSLVTPINGSIYCENIENVSSNCSGFAPSQIVWTQCGPRLFGQNTMYLFDGSSTSCWPVHNPCEHSSSLDNHKKNVENPDGFIFLRP